MKSVSFAPLRSHPALSLLNKCPSCGVLRPAGKNICPFCFAGTAAQVPSEDTGTKGGRFGRAVLIAGLAMAALAALALRFR